MVRDAKPTKKTLRGRAKERFAVAEKMEKEYLRALRQLTRQIDHMVKGMIDKENPTDTIVLQNMLKQYSQTITPWAESVAEKMLSRIASKNELEWAKLGNEVGRALKKELVDAPIGDIIRERLREQVTLITSLPLEAAKRVHHMAMEGMTQGKRADEIAKDILETGSVTESRAKLIARTEVARVASELTVARSKSLGATHFIWRTSEDGSVRDSHKKHANKIYSFDNPPIVDGEPLIPGQTFRCRCWPEPILTED